jgi:hypothetical protein
MTEATAEKNETYQTQTDRSTEIPQYFTSSGSELYYSPSLDKKV